MNEKEKKNSWNFFYTQKINYKIVGIFSLTKF